HDAGAVAAKKKIGDWFSSTAQRKKLFELRYPLAWGKKTVQADAFLTGLVTVSPDRKKCTVEITWFDTRDPNIRTLRQFSLVPDRDLMRDLGYSFALSRSQRKALLAKRSEGEVDRFAVDAVPDDDKKPNPGDKKKPGEASPGNVAGIEVKM